MRSDGNAATANRKLSRQKLPDILAAQILNDIRAGVYRDGDVFPSERELMDTFGVGRSTVREALATLSRLGFIAVRSGTRDRVQHPTADDLLAPVSDIALFLVANPVGAAHFHELRTLMEVGMARRAAELADDVFIEELAQALAHNRDALADPKLFVETDYAFHAKISAVTDNPLFPAFIKAMSTWLWKERNVTVAEEGQNEISLAFHTRIFEAIAQRDVERAGEEMRLHLAQVQEVFRRRAAETP
jgi:DNA-binding FadR family transcriptional regulator